MPTELVNRKTEYTPSGIVETWDEVTTRSKMDTLTVKRLGDLVLLSHGWTDFTIYAEWVPHLVKLLERAAAQKPAIEAP